MAEIYNLTNIDFLLDPIRIGATGNAWVNVSEIIREYASVSDGAWSNIGGKLTLPAADIHFTVASSITEAGTNYAATYGLRYLTLKSETIELPPKQDQYGEDVYVLGAETDKNDLKATTATTDATDNTIIISNAAFGGGVVAAGDIVYITGWDDLNGQYGVAAITNVGGKDAIELITAGYGGGFITSTSPAGGAEIHKCDIMEFVRGSL